MTPGFIKLIKLPSTIIKFYRLTRKSNFKGGDRKSLFYALVRSYIGKTFFSDKKKIRMKLFDYNITAFNYHSFLTLLTEIFISKVYYVKTGKDRPFIIDCGANIGMATIFFKKLYPQSKILCFEPNPETFDLLQKNISENNLSNVTAYNYALSNSEESAVFYTGNPNPVALGNVSCSLLYGHGGPVKIDVACARLSNYIQRPVDILKVDIEGAETQLVEDLYESNSLKYIKSCVLEYHHNIMGQESQLGKFISRFEDEGFRHSLSGWYKNAGDVQSVFIHFYRL